MREAITDIGWHVRLPFFTRIEQEVSLMNQVLYLGGTGEPMRIISQENVALWTSALLTYRILSLQTWAIENLNPQELLSGDYDGIVKDILQAQKVDQLISDRASIKEKIFLALKSRPINEGGPTLEQKYGIEVVSFVLKETRFGDKLVAAHRRKEAPRLIAEAENYAADQEASRIRKLYAAYLEGIRPCNAAWAARTAQRIRPCCNSWFSSSGPRLMKRSNRSAYHGAPEYPGESHRGPSRPGPEKPVDGE